MTAADFHFTAVEASDLAGGFDRFIVKKLWQFIVPGIEPGRLVEFMFKFQSILP